MSKIGIKQTFLKNKTAFQFKKDNESRYLGTVCQWYFYPAVVALVFLFLWVDGRHINYGVYLSNNYIRAH